VLDLLKARFFPHVVARMEDVTKSMGVSDLTPARAPRKSRTRSGCLTCRARKKKCDEVHPRCAGCRRNQLVCEWPNEVSRRRIQNDDSAVTIGLGQKCSQLVARRSTTKIPPSLPNMPSAEDRACALTPHSTALLSHYFRETASFFAMTPLRDNPFVTVFLPIGYADDLLMHGMLAFSGAHLTCKESDNAALASATQLHYLRLINGLRMEVANLEEGDLAKTERLLRVLMIVCHYEVGVLPNKIL
jgi:hypothetical protein